MLHVALTGEISSNIQVPARSWQNHAGVPQRPVRFSKTCSPSPPPCSVLLEAFAFRTGERRNVQICSHGAEARPV